ncbi:uncharacterized protein METZ01_LOCUS204152 [marine metagenome]|uniref:Diaminopimelate epimerase n=1 Tax=marine metagenome TaxID=408172 RepID=A0A382EKR0_9ZZZZ
MTPPDGLEKASAAFFKGHGLGNDYLVFESGNEWILDTDTIVSVCDRWRGPGSDGIVLLQDRSEDPFSLRMFNPDGSEFERSGNGLRILAGYLAGEGLVGGDPFNVSVGGDIVQLHVLGRCSDGRYDISAEMGQATLGPRAVGFDSRVLDKKGCIDLGTAGKLMLNLVSIGNPHAVVFPEVWQPEAMDEIGPLVANHSAFVRGTNVQLARVIDEGLVEAVIWERGVGPTSASGTSACAVATAAVESGRANPGVFQIRMEGGTVEVTVSPERELTLRGPVQEVYRGSLTAGFIDSLG